MRSKSVVLLLMALGCGLVASVGINQVLADRSGEPAAVVEKVKILVANADVPMGASLKPEMVREEDWPKDKVWEDALTNLADANGKVTRTLILKDEPIRKTRLGQGDTAVEYIPPGYRVIPVRVESNTGGSGLILPGNRVDVMVYMREGVHQKPRTKTILEDVKVFAVNETFKQDPVGGEKTIVAKTISLLVTPAQAEKIALAEESGKIRLTMRSPDDASAANTNGAGLDELFDKDKGNRREESGQPDTNQQVVETPGNRLADSIQQVPSHAPPTIKRIEVHQMVILERADARVVEFRDGKPLPDEISRAQLSGPNGGAADTSSVSVPTSSTPNFSPPDPSLLNQLNKKN